MKKLCSLLSFYSFVHLKKKEWSRLNILVNQLLISKLANNDRKLNLQRIC